MGEIGGLIMKFKVTKVTSNYDTIGNKMEGVIAEVDFKEYGILMSSTEGNIKTSKIEKMVVKTANTEYELEAYNE